MLCHDYYNKVNLLLEGPDTMHVAIKLEIAKVEIGHDMSKNITMPYGPSEST